MCLLPNQEARSSSAATVSAQFFDHAWVYIPERFPHALVCARRGRSTLLTPGKNEASAPAIRIVWQWQVSRVGTGTSEAARTG